MSNIHTFLAQARERGLSDEQILSKLTARGWSTEAAHGLLNGDDLVAPTPETAQADPDTPTSTSARTEERSPAPQSQEKPPLAVVERYTTRGIEYGIQFLALGIGAISLGILLHDLANKALDPGYTSGSWVAMAGAAALVSIPIFTILFLRLKRAEKTTPVMRHDSSRRKWVQLSLLISFLWGVWTIVQYLYDLLAGNNASQSERYCTLQYPSDCPQAIGDGNFMTLQIVHMLITIIIAGGIFAYYWIDEHKKDMN